MPQIVWTIRPTYASLVTRRLRMAWYRYVGGFIVLLSAIFVAVFLWRAINFLNSGGAVYKALFLEPSIKIWWWLFVLCAGYIFYRFNKDLSRPSLQQATGTATVEKYLSPEVWKMLEEAFRYARKFNHAEVTEVHFLAAALKTRTGQAIFSRLGVNPEKLFNTLSRAFSALPTGGEAVLSLGVGVALNKGAQLALERKSSSIEVGEIILSIARGQSLATEVLAELAVEPNMIANITIWFSVRQRLSREIRRRARKAAWRPRYALDRAYLAVATPLLDRMSRDFTYLAAHGYLKPCLGRDKEISEIFRVITGGQSSVVLVGEAGVGKTAIVEGIAQLMVAEDVPELFKDKKLLSLSVPTLVGGAASAEEVEQRLLQAMNEIVHAGNIVLYIEDVHNLVGQSTGGKENLDVAELIANFISDNKIITISSTSPRDFAAYLDGTSLGRAMQKVKINEPDTDQAIQILEATVGLIEYKQKIYFSYGALVEAVNLSRRYLPDQWLPEKAIRLCEEVAVYVQQKKGDQAVIEAADVTQLVAGKVNVPITQVSKSEGERLLNLEKILHQRIIGQDEAVSLVAAALRRARTELRSAARPIATFLFLGPTGVGKTELAKTVAAEYFGGENKMIRLDMSEYQTPESLYRLIGSPTGKATGYLTEAVRQSPYALILLDEFEKSHSDILNVFLQLFDDGRLTDASGRTVDFTNTIIIATSNAASDIIQDSLQKKQSVDLIRRQLLTSDLKRYFKPELINRFDGVVVFTPLSMDEVVKITKLLLNKVGQTLTAKGITLRVTDAAVKELAQEGFDPLYGARPLQRAIQDKVDNALANYLLTGKLTRRDVVVLEPGGNIRIDKARRLS